MIEYRRPDSSDRNQVGLSAKHLQARLAIHTVWLGERFGRIYGDRFSNPLGFGKTPSRYSDPRRRADANRFGVLYLGDTLKVCFLEAVLRDRRDGLLTRYPCGRRSFSSGATPRSKLWRRSSWSICARIAQSR